MTTAIAPAPTAKPSDFADLVGILDRLSHAANQLARLEQTLNAQHLDTIRGHMPVYKELQATVADCEAALEVIAARNPQWFESKKSVATPVGEVKRTTSNKIEIADPLVTMTLILAAGRAGDFIRTEEALRIEVLETLDDDQLAKFGVKRVTTHNYKIAPASVDLGKAVKAAEKSDSAAAKTVKKSRT